MSRSRDVVEIVARALVDQPELVLVSESEGRDGWFIEVSAAAGDLGKMIGRQGRTASAVRTLATVAAESEGTRVSVDFVDGHD